jgi:hypothetical protein
MDMISAGIIGLVFVLLIVFTVLTRETWHWINIVMLNLTFLTGLGAIIGLSKVTHMRSTDIRDANEWLEKAEKYKKDADFQIYGDPASIIYDRGSLRGEDLALKLAQEGRGRVWSGGQVAIQENFRKFTFSAERPAEVASQLKDVLLYAFADGANGYPQNYIGTVFVTEETPADLVLQPMFIADGAQWKSPSATWSLFEKMPLDRRDTFKKGIIAQVDSAGDSANQQLKDWVAGVRDNKTDISGFRELLTGLYFKPEMFRLDPTSAEYEKLIDRYAFDGMSLGQIQNWIDANSAGRVSQRFEPAPEEVFVQYEFNKKSSKTYQVDADGSLETDGPFTPLGQAIEPALHAGKEIEFAKGDRVLVDQLTADGYQRGTDQIAPFKSSEDVTEVDRIYIRQLRDFPFLLADVYSQTIKFIEETQRVQANNAVQEKSLADTQSQSDDRANTKAGLEEDLTNQSKDQDTISTLLAEKQEEVRNLKAQIQSMRAEIDRMYIEVQTRARSAEGRDVAGRR